MHRVHTKSCNHTNYDVFDDFPKISDHFRKISLERFCSQGLTNVSVHFPKIAEDFQVGTDDVSIIQQHIWVLFKGLCSYISDWLIFLHVKISYFYMWKYMDFLSGRNPNKTLVFIIKDITGRLGDLMHRVHTKSCNHVSRIFQGPH